ncbi:WRKY transcription factor 55 [Acorus calamus]|uniref:WRKY transcription factor 55 n=1 Tax=Acorus calamus TaxID=4465 RepID=A0AAV9EDD5_ACOCL|nr:WRKY transcription factor 55 [Acorus calamus]
MPRVRAVTEFNNECDISSSDDALTSTPASVSLHSSDACPVATSLCLALLFKSVAVRFIPSDPSSPIFLQCGLDTVSDDLDSLLRYIDSRQMNLLRKQNREPIEIKLWLFLSKHISETFRHASDRLSAPPPPTAAAVAHFEAPPNWPGYIQSIGGGGGPVGTESEAEGVAGTGSSVGMEVSGEMVGPSVRRPARKRSYYRCTHKNYGCDAKKQVQRLDEDPNTYEVTYCDPHTCRTSPTPLLIFPGQATAATSTSIQLGMGSWASMGLDVGREPIGPSVGSGSQHAREVDCPVAELADVMFNSGSSGSGSMEAILGLKTR